MDNELVLTPPLTMLIGADRMIQNPQTANHLEAQKMDARQYAEAYQDACQEIADLEQRLNELRSVAEFFRVRSEGFDPAQGCEEATQPTGRFADLSQSQAAKILLRDAGQPLPTAEIAERLVAGGYPARDIDRLKASLFTTMQRQEHTFVKAGKGLWRLNPKLRQRQQETEENGEQT